MRIWLARSIIEPLLRGVAVDPKIRLTRVLESKNSRVLFADPQHPMFPWKDIEYCTDLNRYSFAMIVTRENGQFVMKPRYEV